MLRSLLFAPGNNARRSRKALTLDADAVILDLEDACPLAEKVAARDTVRATLAEVTSQAVHVRINGLETEFAYGDLLAVASEKLRGIMVPKVETAADVAIADWMLSQIEREKELEPGCIELVALIETARGIANAAAIASASPRLRRLAFGAADYTLDLGMVWTEQETELLCARTALAAASRLAAIEPPIDTPWIVLDDRSSFRQSIQRARALGFQGKLCIHPDQVGEVNQAFMPSDEEIRHARAILEAADAAGGGATRIGGAFIDQPIVDRARKMLAESAASRHPAK